MLSLRSQPVDRAYTRYVIVKHTRTKPSTQFAINSHRLKKKKLREAEKKKRKTRTHDNNHDPQLPARGVSANENARSMHVEMHTCACYGDHQTLVAGCGARSRKKSRNEKMTKKRLPLYVIIMESHYVVLLINTHESYYLLL